MRSSVDGEQFFTLLVTAARLAVDQLHERLPAAGFDGLRPAHGFAFSLITQRGGATASELADHLSVSKQAAGQMIDYLEGHGYLERQPHPQDRRVKVVTLTARGRACTTFVVATMDEIVGGWSAVLEEGQLARTAESLAAIIAGADGTLDQPGLRPTW